MEKTPLYFMPGLAASPKIFENLAFDIDRYTLHYLNWIAPQSSKEDINSYAYRLSAQIKEKNPVLIGVSFGGIIVQELASYVHPKKVIIVSSVKHQDELPKRFKIAKLTKIYKVFPTVVIENLEDYLGFFIGKGLKKRADLYKKYLSVRSKEYLQWSINSIINWQQTAPIKNIVHIHGTNDAIFPIKNIQNTIKVEGGTHIMVLTKAKKVSKIIDAVLTC